MASTSRVDTKYDPETIVSKNNHISSTATSSSSAIISGTFGYNDFSYCDDPKNAIIDETFMPVELRGKTWTINKVLGEGGNFKVYLTTNSDGLEFAMRWNRKQDRSTGVYEENEERQLRTVSRMKLHSENAFRLKELIGYHPNIVMLIGFRKVNLYSQQIMEYVNGGDLYDFIEENYIRKKRRMGTVRVRSLFRDLLKAVKHIHNLHIAHMDIKVENCLLTQNGSLKLTDFDHAKHFTPGVMMPGSVYATEAYAAPETFDKEYRPDCADIWACGILLWFLLKNNVPWEVADRIRDTAYRKWYQSERKACFFHFSKAHGRVSELLLKMLETEADERPTVDEIIAHQWLQCPRKTSEK